MNQRLSDQRIRMTCRELLKTHGDVSGRRLRAELRRRFGAVGKTTRVFRIWREECANASVPADVANLKKQLEAAESAAAENLKRAELAEYRERAHQDHWAMEIDRLKQQLDSRRATEAGQGVSIPFRV
jgi:uncharacterized coiled-coil DUF342 family protein